MSSITTKQGDTGSTRLYSGETVNKRSKRITACGDIDELVSALGIAYAELNRPVSLDISPEELVKIQDVLESITCVQRKLFLVASEIATLEPKLSSLKERIDDYEMNNLDYRRDKLEKKIELPKGFVLPGSNTVSAHLDMARSISRRCERTVVELYNEGFISNKFILMWMNRLSDYLYLLARYSESNNYRMVK